MQRGLEAAADQERVIESAAIDQVHFDSFLDRPETDPHLDHGSALITTVVLADTHRADAPALQLDQLTVVRIFDLETDHAHALAFKAADIARVKRGCVGAGIEFGLQSQTGRRDPDLFDPAEDAFRLGLHRRGMQGETGQHRAQPD